MVDTRSGAPAVPDAPVCIIGAGPAGLAVARALTEQGIEYVHVERHVGVGGLWDQHNPGTPLYDSAHFISSKTLSGFSGFPMPADFPDYPRHDQILSYLQDFAEQYGLTNKITFLTAVTDISRDGNGAWRVTTQPVDRHGEAVGEPHTQLFSAVVACSGVQWHPNIPEIPGEFAGSVRHSITFKSGAEFAGKRVLVVGAGNSGVDIACDAARSANEAYISMRRGYWFIPKHIFGKPVDVFADGGPSLPKWLEQRVFGRMLRILQGDPQKLGLQRPDHKLFETHPIINSMLLHYLQHGDISAKPGIDYAEGNTVFFTDGTQVDVDEIVLATGYQHKVPYAQRYFGDEQHPNLYLSVFSREHTGLYGVGFVETNSGAYQLFDKQAHLLAHFLKARLNSEPQAAAFTELIHTDTTDLSGGISFVSSPRHQGYVDSHAFSHHLVKVAKKFGWSLSSDGPSQSLSATDVRELTHG